MVLQVRADAGQIDLGLDAMTLQEVRRANAREVQKLRRSDGARAQQDFSRCLHLHHFTAVP